MVRSNTNHFIIYLVILTKEESLKCIHKIDSSPARNDKIPVKAIVNTVPLFSSP